jgi:diaminopimelate epimerase
MQRLYRHVTASGGTTASSAAMTIETDAGVLAAAILLEGPRVGQVCVDLGCPNLAPDGIPTTLPGDRIIERPLEVGPWRFDVTCVSTGSPHVVIFVDDIDGVDLPTAGPLLENHAVFPGRVNVHFARVATRSVLDAVHWERGSGITQACGTGASAACVAGVLTGRTDRDIEVRMLGGSLWICWDQSNHVFMTGPAVEVFSGDWPE